MKTKKVLCSLAICCLSVFGVLGLSGCGNVSIQSLSETFQELDAVYQQYSNIFTEGELEGLETKYVISTYSDAVDEEIASNTEGYVELLDLYNATLVIANDYTDSNRDYVLSREEDALSSDSRRAINNLNESLNDYIDSIHDFVLARTTLIEHFDRFAGQIPESDESSLLRFKKVYGRMVANAVTVSTDVATLVETTDILELLRKTEPTPADTETVKEYIRAKLLPIFSEFRISQIENNMNWSAQREGDCKARITALMESMNEAFENFKSNFVTRDANIQRESEQINLLFDLAEEFFKEADQFYIALERLDLPTLAISYDNELSTYLSENELAEVYLTKLEQFANISLPSFMDEVCEIIYP